MIELEELKKLQIEILDDVVEFCEQNKINYWLNCGTLLGAIRHKGYIPWDDDIDIGMLRKDYDIFKEKYNKANRKYRKIGEKLAVNIDIFVYDNAPDDIKTTNKMYRKIKILEALNIVKKVPYSTKKNHLFVNILRFPCHYILKLFPKSCFSKEIVKISKKYIDKKTNYIGSFSSLDRIHSRKSIFESFIKVKFEGKEYNAPIGYDELLTDFYGDYMKLPPTEKQVSHHVFEAFWIEENKQEK